MAVRNLADSLLDASLLLASELSLPLVLQRIVELATEVTGARYGALGVLGPEGRILEFVTTGVTTEQREHIGHLPIGKGILGLLITEARTIRIPDIAQDARSVGFPPNHPPMHSFLGAPVKAGGKVFGNISLTEKQGGAEFTEEDEKALDVLASQAGVAVENARLYEESRKQQQRLEAVREITALILEGADSTDVLRLVAMQAREMVGADLATVAVAAAEAGTLVLEVAEGLNAERLAGMMFPAAASLSGDVMASGATVVVEDASADERAHQPMVRAGEFGPAMFVPLKTEEEAFGTLAVANALTRRVFDEHDVSLVETFAGQAAVALAYAHARRELERLVLMEDRERIAKELHDGVIQSLFAVGMGLQATATVSKDPEIERRVEAAVAEIDRVIRDLRNYIFGLRPGILADRQLDQALRQIVAEFEEKTGVVAVPGIDPRVAAELGPRAADVLQLAREALSNVGRHADAHTCRVGLSMRDGAAVLEIDDDGSGFDPAAARGTGHGLRNLEERALSMGGGFEIKSSPGEGTTVRVTIPLQI
jgi:signal transduction histidine kinase